MNKINIKPLSVNEAWRGRRFKTKKYKEWERLLLYTLPPKIGTLGGEIYAYFEWGISLSFDIDNPNKVFLDLLQKKYGFDDKYVFHLHNKKVLMGRGGEYIVFELFSDKDEYREFIYKNI